VIVEYAFWTEAWDRFVPEVRRLIEETRAQRVCELGAGANPALTLEEVRSRQLDYVLVDADVDELAKADARYRSIVADVTAPGLKLGGRYDVVFSKTLVEHVRDPEAFHRNVFELLRPGGKVLHFFPTLYAPPFLLNRLLPETVTRQLLERAQSGREQEGTSAKFRAYYRWCRGPTLRQIGRFRRLGYEVERYVGFFGHSGYFERVRTLRRLDEAVAAFLVRHPHPLLTSYAHVVLAKPGPSLTREVGP
jgi:2-polyprenyl-3-methyl-5-hydroxy-6-metoxy-1,4-benzoquinol methylase